MKEFVPGQRWICDADLQMGLGTVMSVEQRTVSIVFNAVGETRTYARESAPLTRAKFSVGEVIPALDGREIHIEAVLVEEDLLVYVGTDGKGAEAVLVETDLAHMIQLNRPAERIFNRQIDKDKWFNLRYLALRESNRQLGHDLYGLVGTRTSLIPHQLYIAHEVSRRYAPRVLLADEVGLGKTIEAGLILHQQLLMQRAERVLIVVPESLLHQWLVEMLRRFNLLFSVFDEERCLALEESHDNPYFSEQLVLCDLEFFVKHPKWFNKALAGSWDLLIVDEAHHLQWSPESVSAEYQCVEQLAQQTKGVLLLTATPEQLGKLSHFARLRLLDPDRFSNYEAFIREETEYEKIATAIQPLLQHQPVDDSDLEKLQRAFTDDDVVQLLGKLKITDDADGEQSRLRQELVERLLDRHGTGRVLFRNTRSAVKGFPQRQVTAYPMALPEAYSKCLSVMKDGEPTVTQALLNPEVVYTSNRSSNDAHWTRIDPRLDWLGQFLKSLRPEKVLVITARKQTALDIAEALKTRAGIYTAAFHEGMSLLERDRAAAYFADSEEACQVLVCSEIGSEGRNFQFAHHLVLFDLPINPDLLEQRIGRLDRIGQTETINIHVPYLEDSGQSVMYHWYHEGLNAFKQTCPAGYPVFIQQQDDLLQALRVANVEHHDMPAFIETTRALHAQQEKILQQGRDRLLEFNSCRPGPAAALKQQAIEINQDKAIEEFMEGVFDCFGVNVEEHSLSTYIISPGEHMLAPFPGLEYEGMLMTFSRELALSNEDRHLFTWEHPLVLTSLDMVLSSEFGNAVVTSIEHGEIEAGTLLLECLFVIEVAQVKGMQANRYFPSNVITVLIDEKEEHVNAIDHASINDAIDPIPIEIARQVIKMKETEIRRMLSSAEKMAQQQLPKSISAAEAKMMLFYDAEIARLESLSKVNKNIRTEEIEYYKDQQEKLSEIYKTASLRLDAMRVIVAT